jgi:hypothetical protein
LPQRHGNIRPGESQLTQLKTSVILRPPTGRIEEECLVEQLVAHAAVEALREAFPHRLARGDEVPVNAVVLAPGQHGVARVFGAVIADDHTRLAMPLDDRG